MAADLSRFCCFIPLVRLPQGCQGDAQLLRGERGSLAQQRVGGVPRVRAAVLRRGGLVPLLGHLEAGDVRRTRFSGPRHLCAFIFISFSETSMVVLRAIGLTSCFLITGKLRRVELLGVFRRCSGEFIFISYRAGNWTDVVFCSVHRSVHVSVPLRGGCDWVRWGSEEAVRAVRLARGAPR